MVCCSDTWLDDTMHVQQSCIKYSTSKYQYQTTSTNGPSTSTSTSTWHTSTSTELILSTSHQVMRHKVADVVYCRFNKHCKFNNQHLCIQLAATPTEYRCLSVSLAAENVRLGNNYFLTSTSTQKLYLSTDQVPCTTRLMHSVYESTTCESVLSVLMR